MKKLYFGSCEHCGKDYLVKGARQNKYREIRCPHCKAWSGNGNSQIKDVRELIQMLKKFSPNTKVFFSYDSELHDYCFIDEFDETIIIRPAGNNFIEHEVKTNINEQRQKEQMNMKKV